jgi:DNA polymerase-1
MTREQAVEVAKILQTLIEIAKVDIILNTFISAFIEKSVLKEDGVYYLHGNFNLGGTISGRLSSSGPNLQNLPSTGSVYAPLVKSCFSAPSGFLMGGADFWSLEDRISALTTRDPNKLKVYCDGYDGHCLRAYSYFRDEMPDITDSVESINSIETGKYKHLRQKSKMPTFALTYAGTWHTLVNNLGLTPEEAKNIEAQYHKLYAVSDQWVQDRIIEATKCGYVVVAFGLRLRTPILSQTVLGNRSTPYEAQGEARSAGNALGQSWGMLNNRAAIEFQARVLASPYRTKIRPIAHIHDSQYFLLANEVGCVEWVNRNLIECMQWTGLPEIQHPVVKLGGNLEIYQPSWAKKYSIPNLASKKEILDICTPKA